MNFSSLEPRTGHCVSRSEKMMERRPKAAAAAFMSVQPVMARRPWRTKCEAMPGLQPKEKTQVRPAPALKAGCARSPSSRFRSSSTSAQTSKPVFRKCAPRDLTSAHIVTVSMRVASSTTMSPAASLKPSTMPTSVSRETGAQGWKLKRPSTEGALISGAQTWMEVMSATHGRRAAGAGR